MIALLLHFKYVLLAPIALIEGPFVMMFSGLLIKLGILSVIPTYLLLWFGDLVGDILWYQLGHRFGMKFVRRFGKFFNVFESDIEKVKRIFHKYHAPILFLSKITMGLGFALVTLITAGLVNIPLKKFTLWNAVGGIFWTGFLMTIGYVVGNYFIRINNIFGKISIVALYIIIFLVLVGIAQAVRKKLIKSI